MISVCRPTTQLKNKLKNIAKKENIDINYIYIYKNNNWINFNDWKNTTYKDSSCQVKYNIGDIEKYPKKICSILKSGFLRNLRRTDKEWRNLIQERKPGYTTISTEPILTNRDEITLLCPEGHLWRTTPDNCRLRGCEECGNIKKGISRKKKCANNFLEKVKKDNPNVEILSEYINAHAHVDCRCKICGHEWPTSATHLFGKTPTGCNKCGIKRQSAASTYSKEEVIEKIMKHKPKNIEIPDNFEYTPSNVKKGVGLGQFYLFCNKKNHGRFKCDMSKIKRGIMCSKCTGGISVGEIHISIYFDNNIMNYIHNKYCGVKSVGRFDFQEINNMKINLEYDGYPFHFDYTYQPSKNGRSRPSFNLSKEAAVIGFINRRIKDTKKNLYCLKNNILLIRMPYTIDTCKKINTVLDEIFANIKNEKREIIYVNREIYIEQYLIWGKVKCAVRTLQKKFRNKRKLENCE